MKEIFKDIEYEQVLVPLIETPTRVLYARLLTRRQETGNFTKRWRFIFRARNQNVYRMFKTTENLYELNTKSLQKYKFGLIRVEYMYVLSCKIISLLRVTIPCGKLKKSMYGPMF